MYKSVDNVQRFMRGTELLIRDGLGCLGIFLFIFVRNLLTKITGDPNQVTDSSVSVSLCEGMIENHNKNWLDLSQLIFVHSGKQNCFYSRISTPTNVYVINVA